MGTNTLLTITMVTRELIRCTENELMFARGVSKGYDDHFAKTGAKIGDTVNIRMPNRFYAANGANFVSQDYTESNVALQLDSRKHVGFGFTSQDKTLSLDDYSERTLKPAAIALANKIDLDGLALAKAVYNNVGTVGSTPGTAAGNGTANSASPDVFTNAGMMLDNFSAPRGPDRYCVLNPAAAAGTAKGLSSLYNPQAKISQLYMDGRMQGTHLGFNIGMDQNINTLTTGTRVNGTVNGANQTGATINLTGIGNATTIVIGDKFTIANVYSVNPVNQQSTGQLQQFAATTANTANATGVVANLGITPSIVVAAANVANGTVNALPANGAALTWSGGAGVAAVQNLTYHKAAVAFATADLEEPDGNVEFARMNHNGISLRVVKFYDGANDLNNCRVDVLYGWKLVRPEHCCVIWG